MARIMLRDNKAFSVSVFMLTMTHVSTCILILFRVQFIVHVPYGFGKSIRGAFSWLRLINLHKTLTQQREEEYTRPYTKHSKHTFSLR